MHISGANGLNPPLGNLALMLRCVQNTQCILSHNMGIACRDNKKAKSLEYS